MSLGLKIALIWGVCLLSGIALIPYFIGRAKRKSLNKVETYNIAKVEKKYKFYSTNFLTRKKFSAIIKSYISLSCLTEVQLKNKSVKLFEKSIIASAVIPVILLVFTRDVVVTLLGLLVSMVYYNITVSKDIEEVYSILIDEASNLVQSIHLNYMEFHNIPRSVLEGDRGQYLTVIVDEIYNAITALDSKKELNAFIAKCPLKVLAELAMVCQITNEYGDSVNSNGQYKFEEQLGIIEKEINLELRIVQIQKLKFKLLDSIALAGIVFMPIVDWFLLGQIPGTSIIIKGVIGQTTKVIVIVSVMVALYVISNLTKKSVVSNTDVSEIVYYLSQNKKLKWLIDGIKPKSYKNIINVESLLEESLSSHSMETFYTAKLYSMVIVFLLSIVLSVAFVVTSKIYIYTNTGSLAYIPMVVEKRVQEDIDKMDKEYMKMKEKPTGEELLTYISSRVRGINQLDTQIQAKRMIKKVETYEGIGFKWYYFIVIYLVSIVGWFVPNMQINLRKNMVKYEADEDASQLQTVMVTLSGTGLSVYEILHRLLDLSTIHKSSISYACQTFIKDPEFAVGVLSDNSKIREFKRMCMRLSKSVFNVPVRDAFKNIVVEKEQSIAIKEMNVVQTVHEKANLASILACTPVILVLVLQALLPIAILGVTQLVEMQSVIVGM